MVCWSSRLDEGRPRGDISFMNRKAVAGLAAMISVSAAGLLSSQESTPMARARVYVASAHVAVEGDGRAATARPRHHRSADPAGHGVGAARKICPERAAHPRLRRSSASDRLRPDNFATLHRRLHDGTTSTEAGPTRARDRHGLGLSGGGAFGAGGGSLHD